MGTQSSADVCIRIPADLPTRSCADRWLRLDAVRKRNKLAYVTDEGTRASIKMETAKERKFGALKPSVCGRKSEGTDQAVMQTPTEGLLFSEMTAQREEPCWLAAAQRGEPQALERMFQDYHGPVYALCYRMLSRPDDAEDATQATFVSAFRGLARFRGQSSLKTWLYRIAVNESLNLLRQRRRAPAVLAEHASIAVCGPNIEETAAVQSALQRMRPEQRLVLILHYWEELSCDEIASVINISVSATKMRLKRARDEFQRQYGGEP